MQTTRRFTTSVVIVVVLCLAGARSSAQQKRPITHDVYDSWKSIQGTKVSRDGSWVAYALTPQEGDGELVVRHLKTNTEYRAARGRDPVITPDGKIVVFAKAPLKADVDKARKAKKKPEEMPKAGVGVIDLSNGRVTTLAEHVKSFRVPDDPVKFVAYLRVPDETAATHLSAGARAADERAKAGQGRERQEGQEGKAQKKHEPGTDLVIRDLITGAEQKIAEVAEYSVSRDGSAVAYSVSSKTPSKDGAFVRKIADGSTKTLMTGEGAYKGFAFDSKATQLAFVSNRDDHAAKAPRFKLYHATMTAASAAELAVPTETRAGLPAEARASNGRAEVGPISVSEFGRLEFSKDGARLFFGTAAPPRAEPDDTSDMIKVDIWHYKDPEIQPMQKVRAEEERKRNFRAVIHLADKRFTQLASPDMPDIRVGDSDARGLGISDVPYRQLISWDGSYDDVYLVSLADGTRQQLLEKANFPATMSPGGNYVLYFEEKDDNWYAIRTSDRQKVNLTAKLGVKFQSETDDRPEHATPYGSAGWTDGDKSVLLYDRYDIWEVKPDGSGARMVTNGIGRAQQIIFRLARTEPAPQNNEPEEGGPQRRQADAPPVSATRPVLLSATDDRTKAQGIYRVTLNTTAEPAKLVMLDKAISAPIKARDADVYVFTTSTFQEFPDLWTSSGAFTDMKKVSDANSQQAHYNWGRSELIEYVNADGKRLRAILTKPEDFDPSKKYPLLVYIYEQLSQNLHRYVPPAPSGSSINVTRYVSNGYIVLQPDIVYDLGYPGLSALKCVLPAVQKVQSLGSFVDPARIGIQGHSWGGYQVSYMITRTNIFRAVEAGASVGDMFGGYGGIRWGTGMSRAFQYEKTQSRIGVPPWENPLIYMENSPLFYIEKIQTPYLTMANDEDDAVPWQQGIEFFTAMRRLGKEAYMFVYNGEKHGLRQRENQKHWTVHMAEYFDYYLKGAPKPDWMEHGVPYLDKGMRDVSVFYKKSTDQK